MSDRFPLMRSLDPYHQRIGYLGAVALVGYRGLDSRESVRARLEELLYRRITVGSAEYSALVEGMGPERCAALEKARATRTPEDDPAAILRSHMETSDWLYVSEAWVHQDRLPSPLGFVSPNKVDRLIDLARWTGILTPSFELSEPGFVLQHALSTARSRTRHPELFNVLDPAATAGLPLIYLRLLMSAEILWPSLVCELVERSDQGKPLATRGDDALLVASVDRLIAALSPSADLADALELREITTFRQAIAEKGSTAENYLRPRLEILVDLGLLGRHASGQRDRRVFAWITTPQMARLAAEWSQLTAGSNRIPAYLDAGFFKSMARVFGVDARPVTDTRRVLLWFAKAFQDVGRDIGFTPGRTLALQACLLAYAAGELLEIAQVFDAVYDAAKSQWSDHLRYSGGSRMDREFMIKVAPALLPALEEDLRARPEVH